MSNHPNQTKEQEIEEVKRHVRQHKILAGVLVACTVLTIGVSQMSLSMDLKIVIALAIACTQGFLIVAFFMNLISEKKMIYAVLAFTTVFFVVQMGITLWARMPGNEVHLR